MQHRHLLMSCFAIIAFTTSDPCHAAESNEQGNKVPVTISQDMSEVVINGDLGHPIHILDEQERQIRQFNTDIASHGLKGKITQCSLVLFIGAGVAHGNTSYGGICSSDDAQRQTVAVCDDKMVGHFRISNVDPQTFSTRQLVEFIVSNCWGG